MRNKRAFKTGARHQSAQTTIFGVEQHLMQQTMPCGGFLVGKNQNSSLVTFVKISNNLNDPFLSTSGTHLNYYMFFGAYNRGRQAAGGISNLYATDAALCSSGQRHEPKFSHYRSLHHAVASIAPTLLSVESAMGKAKTVEVLNQNKSWVVGKKQRMFEYVASKKQPQAHLKQVIFVENDEDHTVVVRIVIANGDYRKFSLAPSSAILVVDGILKFDSATISPKSMSFKREFDWDNLSLSGWSFWPENIGAASNDPITRTDVTPIEQTRLNVDSGVWSDYAWYETTLVIKTNLSNAKLFVESSRSNGLLVFVDDSFVGAAEDHSHIFEGNLTMGIEIGKLSAGQHKLSILSESLGYSNLIGRFGNSGTGPKLKGITGEVFLFHEETTRNISLVDGRKWKSYPGLHGEKVSEENHLELTSSKTPRPVWASFLFLSPTNFNPKFQSLFLRINTGRGHLWLNGKDLGRFWNVTQESTSKYSQEYYFLPVDYLRTDGGLNRILLFNTACSATSDMQDNTKLVISWLSPTNSPNLKDNVSFPLACI